MALQLVTFLMALKDKNIIWADLKAENIGVQTRKLRNKDDEYKIKVLDTKCFLRDDAYLNKAKNTPEAGKGEVISEGSTSAVGQTSSKKEVPQIYAPQHLCG